MKSDSESKPIAFEIARQAVSAVVSTEASDAGKPEPTIALSTIPGTPARTLNAAAHYLALLAELGSGSTERWAIGIEIDRVDLARVFIQTASNTDEEVARARTVLEDVLGAAELARPVPPPNN